MESASKDCEVGSEKRERSLKDGEEEKELKRPPKRRMKSVSPFGNYPSYYHYRCSKHPTHITHSHLLSPENMFVEVLVDDPRIRVLPKKYFASKTCLDVGCNSGLISMELARRFRVRFMTGVDIDESLVLRARETLSTMLMETVEARDILQKKMASATLFSTDWLDKFPNCFPIAYGPLLPSVSLLDEVLLMGRSHLKAGQSDLSQSRKPPKFPFNVDFRVENFVDRRWMEADGDRSDAEEHKRGEGPYYDTIVCFSTTKWIHLNWGDDGIRRLFQRVSLMLRGGGHFIVEFQPWRSYKKRANISDETQKMFEGIRMRPADFPDVLKNDYGFEELEVLRVQHDMKGFSRPIHIFRKTGDAAKSKKKNRKNKKKKKTKEEEKEEEEEVKTQE
eukprot:TRINITY_DN225_c0_g1_i1.p1 TRINITY_DN225_c0_g1~~TRINITY_DN225_c0_g1_i1.p1  ORF type:complete len:391 (-),score=127.34 TRINITY_DN225_c0_g1_i1:135-1307(-)